MRKTSHTESSEPFMEFLLRWLRSRKAEKYIKRDTVVADLGCGYKGFFLKRISEKIKKGVGYDISITRNGLPQNVVLKKANLNKTFNKRGAIFDTVTALAVLEHVENPKHFLSQTKTMLKKDGYLILTTPHKKAKLILEFLAFKVGLINRKEITDHKNYFDQNSLKKLLRSTKFKIIKLETFGFGFNIFLVAQKS